jgi:hypothetical protein
MSNPDPIWLPGRILDAIILGCTVLTPGFWRDWWYCKRHPESR